MFRYFKEGDAVEDRGQTHRVFAHNATPWLLKRLDNAWQLAEETSLLANPIAEITPEDAAAIRSKHEEAGVVFKFKEVEYKDWSMPDEWLKDDDGNSIDPVWGTLDKETGEVLA